MSKYFKFIFIYIVAVSATNSFAAISSSPSPVGLSATSAISSFDGLNRGLVGYWTMDQKDINWTNNTMVDRSGNGNTGTLVALGKATSTVAGKLGQALDFNGSSSGIDAANIASGELTLSAWIKVRGNSSDGDPTNAVVVQANNLRILVFPNSNTVGVVGLNYPTTEDSSAFAWGSISKNKWVFATAVRRIDGTTELYLNGVLFASNFNNGDMGNGAGSLGTNIGTRGFNYHFNGQLDDVRIYNRVLSAMEIKQLYNQAR